MWIATRKRTFSWQNELSEPVGLVWCLCWMPPMTSLSGTTALVTHFLHTLLSHICGHDSPSWLHIKIIHEDCYWCRVADSSPKDSNSIDLALIRESVFLRSPVDSNEPGSTPTVFENHSNIIPQLSPEPQIHGIFYLKKVSTSIRMPFTAALSPHVPREGIKD